MVTQEQDVVKAVVMPFKEAEEHLLDVAADIAEAGPERLNSVIEADPVLGEAVRAYMVKLHLVRSFAAHYLQP